MPKEKEELNASEKMKLLLKAAEDEEGIDNDEDDDDNKYDPAYMKKNLKRYCKDNPEEVQKNMKELGSMVKAVTDEADNIEGIDSGDAVLIDGTDMIKTFSSMTELLYKAFEDITAIIDSMAKEISYNNQICKASGEMLLKASDMLEEIGKTPLGVKATMQASTTLTKANDKPFHVIQSMVMKAFNSGDKYAASVIPELDMCSGDLNRLSDKARSYVSQLIESK